MKHIFSCTLIASLLLFGCSSISRNDAPVLDMDPAEVLKKSAEATRELESATYDGEVRFSRGEAKQNSIEGQATINGRLQSFGKQVQLAAELSLSGSDSGNDFTANGQLEVLIAAKGEVYMRLNSVTIEPDSGFLSQTAVNSMIGTWWLLPPSKGIEKEFATVTPDPGLLRAQAEVVTVVEAMKPVKIHGAYAYHYAVEVDKAKLLTFLQKAADENNEEFDAQQMQKTLDNMTVEGELWIDATSFHTRKIVWNVVQLLEGEEFTMNIAVEMDKHNQADPIYAPKDAKEFSPLLFLQDSLPTVPEFSPLSTDPTEDPFGDLDPETRNILLEVLDQDQSDVSAQ